MNCFTAINSEKLNIVVEYEFITQCEQTDSTPSCYDAVAFYAFPSTWTLYTEDYSTGYVKGRIESDESDFHDMKVELVGHGNGTLEVYVDGVVIKTKEFTW